MEVLNEIASLKQMLAERMNKYPSPMLLAEQAKLEKIIQSLQKEFKKKDLTIASLKQELKNMKEFNIEHWSELEGLRKKAETKAN